MALARFPVGVLGGDASRAAASRSMTTIQAAARAVRWLDSHGRPGVFLLTVRGLRRDIPPPDDRERGAPRTPGPGDTRVAAAFRWRTAPSQRRKRDAATREGAAGRGFRRRCIGTAAAAARVCAAARACMGGRPVRRHLKQSPRVARDSSYEPKAVPIRFGVVNVRRVGAVTHGGSVHFEVELAKHLEAVRRRRRRCAPS